MGKIAHLLHPGAGTIRPEIISSLITGGSEGGGGHTSDSIMSSVDRITPDTRSGGSVRDDLKSTKKKRKKTRFNLFICSRITRRRNIGEALCALPCENNNVKVYCANKICFAQNVIKVGFMQYKS